MTVTLAVALALVAAVPVRTAVRRRRAAARRLPSASPEPPAPVMPAVERLHARRRSRTRALERRRAVPLSAELLRMGVSAGLPPAGAIRHAAPWLSGDARTEFERVVADLEVGLSLREALDDLRSRAPEFRGMARILQSSAELGTEIGPALGRLARDEREALRRAAEIRARTVPVRLLFPLVFLVLPAFVLLGVVPALLAGSPR